MTNKLVSLVLTALFLAMMIIPLTASESAASEYGSAENPIIINDLTELNDIRNDLSAHYRLGNDIDASATIGWNNGTGWIPIGNSSNAFTGSLGGNNYTITGLFINRPTTDYVGLFGGTSSAEIENIGLLDVNVLGRYYVGGLIAYNVGTINQSYATGDVRGEDYVGGLVGYNGGTINQSYASCNVSGSDWYVGGLVGQNNDGTITQSYATGDVSGSTDVGGLVGFNGGTINQSYATGDVIGMLRVGGLVSRNSGTINQSYATGDVSGSTVVGGLVGINRVTITQSYATGDVNGTYYVGGLVGENYDGTITQSYATGDVNGTERVGALAGSNGGTINQSYATGIVTGMLRVGGLVGSNGGTINQSYWNTETSGQSSSAGGSGRTTAEMKQQVTFIDWDFTFVWYINEDVSYPQLCAFDTTTPIADDRNFSLMLGPSFVALVILVLIFLLYRIRS